MINDDLLKTVKANNSHNNNSLLQRPVYNRSEWLSSFPKILNFMTRLAKKRYQDLGLS